MLCSSQAEAELAQQTAGRIGSNASLLSGSSPSTHRLPHNPTRVDRLIHESWREHYKVTTIRALVQRAGRDHAPFNKQSTENAKQFNCATFPWLGSYFLTVARLFSVEIYK